VNLSFVVPVWNEEPTLAALCEGILEHAKPYPCEIIFVNDGSTDGSWETLLALQARHPEVSLLRYNENRGKTAALMAGFRYASGDVIITLDADLQDDPCEIPRLVEKLGEGYGLVCGWKADRKDPWTKRFPSRVFNGAIAAFFGVPLHDLNTGLKAMRADLAKALPLFADMHRMIAVLVMIQGAKVTEIPVKHHPRLHGESKYGFERYYEGIRDAVRVYLLWRAPGIARRLGTPPDPLPRYRPAETLPGSRSF